MKKIYSLLFFSTVLSFPSSSLLAQRLNPLSSISVSGGPFIVGKNYGIWLGTAIEKKLSSHNKKFLNKLTAEGELYFENATDKVTVYNPTP